MTYKSVYRFVVNPLENDPHGGVSLRRNFQLARQMGLSHLWTMISKMWPCSMKEPSAPSNACLCVTKN